MTKQELRQWVRRQKTLHAGEDPSAVIARLRQHPRYASAHTVMLYHALPDEVATEELMNELVAAGKTVLLPKVVSETDMELRRYTGPEDLEQGAFGIMEPNGAVFTDYRLVDVAVVPGMAFDKEGHRLGRGKGYYDRFLSTRFPHSACRPYTIGLCFPWQLVEEVPTDGHDRVMDCVVC